MKRFKVFLALFTLIFMVNVHVPVIDMDFGGASDASAWGFFGWGNDNNNNNNNNNNNGNAHGVPEPSMFLLLGAGFAGYGIHRKFRNRNKEE